VKEHAGHGLSDDEESSTNPLRRAISLLDEGSADANAAAALIAKRLVAAARPEGSGLDWYANDDCTYYMPNFSHGCAGISYALASNLGSRAKGAGQIPIYRIGRVEQQ
jgi:hypothetical protein